MAVIWKYMNFQKKFVVEKFTPQRTAMIANCDAMDRYYGF